MTVATTSIRNDYSGNGTASVFSYTFPISLATDLVVYVVDASNVSHTLAQGTDYTLTGVGSSSGGSVTLVNASQAWLSGGNLASGCTITLIRQQPLTQTTSIRNQGAFFPDVLENTFDANTLKIQQLQEQLSRVPQLAVTDTAGIGPLPNKTNRASKLLGFDASGNPVAVTNSAGTVQVLPAYSADGSYPSPVTGSTYYNTTSSSIRVYNGSSWSGVSGTAQVLPAYAADGSYPSPVTGSTYFNTASSTIRVYNGSAWIAASGGATAALPAYSADASFPSPVAGSTYFNTVSGLIRVYNGTSWSSTPVGTVTTGAGGTGVTAVPTSPAVSAFAAWDANKNLPANNLINGFATTATAGGTTTLTVASAAIQVFTGSANQTVVLPVASTLQLGQQFTIINLSSGTVTVQSSGANTIQALAANTQLVVICQLTSGTGTASWMWAYGPAQSGALSIAQGGTGASTQSAAFSALAPTATTSGQLITWNGSSWTAQSPATATSAGPKNYITFSNFENNATTGWSLANTTLSNNVPNQASGSWTAANANLGISTVSSGPLAGTYSLQLRWNSASASVVGDMLVSQAYSIDIEDQAKVLTFKAFYSATVGASLLNFSGTSANTYQIYIYDVANSAWIQPAGVYGMTQSSGVGYVTGTFQAPSNMTQFRIAIVCVNASVANASGHTILLDDFVCGPQTAPMGPAVGDWVSYTPTFAGFGTPTGVSFKSRRVGDSLEVVGVFTSGTATATQAQITLGYNGGNANVTIDTSKIGTAAVVGEASCAFSSTTFFGISPLITGANNYFCFGQQSSATNPLTAVNGSTLGSTLAFSVHTIVPIVGWSSNCLMSSDTDTRVIALAATGAPANVTAGNPIIWGTVTKDTSAAYNTTTGQYSIPVTGWYNFSAYIAGTPAASTHVMLYKGGVATNVNLFQLLGTASTAGSGSAVIYCNAGDVITVVSVDQNITGFGGNCILSVFRLSGPAVVAATESVAASYNGGTATVTSSYSLLTYQNKDVDTHGIYSAGVATIPVAGIYEINAGCRINGTYSAGNDSDIQIWKNSTTDVGQGLERAGGSSLSLVPKVSRTLRFVAGDTIQIRVSSAATTPTVDNTTFTWFSLKRVGN